MHTRLLVVGVGPQTLGEDIVDQAKHHPYFGKGDVFQADLLGDGEGSGNEEGIRYIDVRNVASVRHVLKTLSPTHVICTAGINTFVNDSIHLSRGEKRDQLMHRSMIHSLGTNAIGPIMMAYAWLDMLSEGRHVVPEVPDWTLTEAAQGFHFSVISSNSAHIARTASAPYCMSKAALSMGMRCIAREVARARMPVAFTTYEPGFLSGTPMSMTIAGSTDEFQEAKYHRIPSGLAMQPTDLAEVILNNMATSWNLMNGACIRLDGGEQ